MFSSVSIEFPQILINFTRFCLISLDAQFILVSFKLIQSISVGCTQSKLQELIDNWKVERKQNRAQETLANGRHLGVLSHHLKGEMNSLPLVDFSWDLVDL